MKDYKLFSVIALSIFLGYWLTYWLNSFLRIFVVIGLVGVWLTLIRLYSKIRFPQNHKPNTEIKPDTLNTPEHLSDDNSQINRLVNSFSPNFITENETEAIAETTTEAITEKEVSKKNIQKQIMKEEDEDGLW